MIKLETDIKQKISNGELKILFRIKSNNELLQMINKLNEIGFCENKEGWEKNKIKAKEVFDSQQSNHIELNTLSRMVTYSSVLKFEKVVGKKDVSVLETSNYLEKQVRKKLKL